jgi:hypothetical protein
MLGYQMYSRHAMMVSLVLIFQACAADSQADQMPQQGTFQQEREISEEWYNALQSTQQKLQQTKSEYDDYYFYSNGCFALVLVVLLTKIARAKFSKKAPSDGMANQPLLQADVENQHVQRGVTDCNIETKYDEIQKRWDEKVVGAGLDDKTQAQYDEIQKRWDEKVVGAGPDGKTKAKYEEIQNRWDEKVLGA